MYLSINSIPGIQFVMYQYDSFTHNPRSNHAEAGNSICWYLVGTLEQVLTFDPNIYMNLYCYLDAYFQDFGNIRMTKIILFKVK